MKIISGTTALTLGLIAILAGAQGAEPTTFQDPNFPLIQVPAQFKSQRQNTSFNLAQGESIELFNATAPGCIRHLWLKPDPQTASPILRIYADDAGTPRVEMGLHLFFGVLLEEDPYRLDNAVFQHLPNARGAGYNSWLPIPFRTTCRITIEASDAPISGACMINWHEYTAGTDPSPYRLHAVHHVEKPAQAGGTFQMADIAGKGFVAGIVKGHRQRDYGDLIFHTGGQRWHIDTGTAGEHEIQGTNLEDDYGFVWGFQEVMTPWIGVPYHRFGASNDQDGIIYRFFGPDPVRFESSLLLQTGSRADDTESVVYYYVTESGD